jgi:hypothetical protein
MRRSLHANQSFRRCNICTIILVVVLTTGGLAEAMADIPNGKLRAYIRSSGHPCAHVIEQEHEVTAKDGVPVEVTPQ